MPQRACSPGTADCAEHSVEAAIFHVFHHRLLANLLSRDLGEQLFAAYVEILNQCIVPTDRIIQQPQSLWFTGRSRSRLSSYALREACADLNSRMRQQNRIIGIGAKFTA